ncbi:MAG: hypothetical protein IT294_14535 [Deltaproteobacteria bacterium]|nr:hypothetical protein [Deltaproteobacteria bacterium]
MSGSRMMMVAACFALAACGGGGGGSNDNGVSLRFSGVFQETREQVAPAADQFPTPEEAVGDTGSFVILGEDLTVPRDYNSDGDLDGGFLGVSNNLDQSVNLTHVTVEIFIPGAKLANPVVTDSVPLSSSLPPATIDDQGVRSPSVSFSQTVFVRPDVLAFLAANQNLLPEPPFDMTVVMTITGISDTGDSFDTNEVSYPVAVLAPSL